MFLLLNIDENSLDVEKLLKAVNIESFRKNNFVNKNKELPPGDDFEIIDKTFWALQGPPPAPSVPFCLVAKPSKLKF